MRIEYVNDRAGRLVEKSEEKMNLKFDAFEQRLNELEAVDEQQPFKNHFQKEE